MLLEFYAIGFGHFCCEFLIVDYKIKEEEIPVSDGSLGGAISNPIIDLTERQKDELVDRLVDGLVDGLVDSQRMLLKLIIKNPKISKKSMAEQIGISTTAVDKNLKTLKDKNIIRRVGDNKSGYWEIISNF